MGSQAKTAEALGAGGLTETRESLAEVDRALATELGLLSNLPAGEPRSALSTSQRQKLDRSDIGFATSETNDVEATACVDYKSAKCRRIPQGRSERSRSDSYCKRRLILDSANSP